ncbi:hypothetical protein MASR2M36_37950 [Providencia sp.]
MLLAWILTRYRFPGRLFLDGLVDLPFALPTAVAGLTLATLFATSGWYGQYLHQFDIKVVNTWLEDSRCYGIHQYSFCGCARCNRFLRN